MEEIGVSLVVGIGSSLVATAIFISLSEFIRKVILPWYADKIYRGVRIDGTWEATKFEGNKIDELMKNNEMLMKMVLRQKGELVSGSYIHKEQDQEIDEYYLSGRIRDMYFLATAIPKSNRKIDGVSLMFHIDYLDSKLKLTGGALCKGPQGIVHPLDGLEFEWNNS
ncbi:hypothetical protein [Microbulbifer sp. SAOS-129_SWC]|uniref:hypothetical protein n=1 Tax=Microbulbifer sp. SAOS-129_SWC TaxID=3145235 RepID=UPI0032174252